jgi:hypothetical protein
VQNKKVVCILDEAHLLERETIEEFRFLLNYKFDSLSPMTLVLVGQTELWDKLKLQRYAAVRQRIDINCVLPHLDRSETERYIQSHLKYADGRQDLFTAKALDDIYRESAGIPRSINRISEKCLMYAFQQNKRLIDEHMVRYVVDQDAERRCRFMNITFQAKLPAGSKTSWPGEIIPIRLDSEPYEIEVTARGSYFHLLVGHHAYGNYICIPNWDIGIELSFFSDIFWNLERLSNTKLKKVDACSVAYALVELSKYINI